MWGLEPCYLSSNTGSFIAQLHDFGQWNYLICFSVSSSMKRIEMVIERFKWVTLLEL